MVFPFEPKFPGIILNRRSQNGQQKFIVRFSVIFTVRDEPARKLTTKMVFTPTDRQRSR